MTDQIHNNNLDALGQEWSQRIKDIRKLAQSESLSDAKDDAGTVSPSDELLSGLPDDTVSDNSAILREEIKHGAAAAGQRQLYPAIGTNQSRRIGILKQLAAGVILSVLVIGIYEILTYLWVCHSIRMRAWGQTDDGQNKVGQTAALQKPAILPDEHPISLKIAQDYYRQGNYAYARAIYSKILDGLEKNEDDGLQEFVKLKTALCFHKEGNSEQSYGLLKNLQVSHLPLIRILANYYLCQAEMRNHQYLSARSRAYQALALLDCVHPPLSGFSRLRKTCDFLAAQAVSRQVLALSDADKELPAALWNWPGLDILSEIDEQSLCAVLNTGAAEFSRALTGPVIEIADRQPVRRWTVISNGTSIGELTSRFAVNTGSNVYWDIASDKTGIHNRPVSLYLRSATEPDCVKIAAGCAGLAAVPDTQTEIRLFNPADYNRVSEQIDLLAKDALSCWQRFLVVYDEDAGHANVHFTMGLLEAVSGRTNQAVAEFLTAAHRFPNSELAPYALVRAAKHKADLYDYAGTYTLLKDTAEQYPDYPNIEQVYLLLADAAVKKGSASEAAKLYSRVYYLNRSPESRLSAALTAGQLFYQHGDFENAELWFNRYITDENARQDRQFHQACLLLGKMLRRQGNSKSAADALLLALSGNLSQADYVEAVTAVVEEYIVQERFIQSLDILNEALRRHLTQQEMVHLLVLKSRVFRGMGLTDKAIAFLNDKESYLLDNSLKAMVGSELSQCYMEQGNWDYAYKKLMQTLEWVQSGPLMHQTMLRLAQVCVNRGLHTQASAVCSQLISLNPADSIRQQAAEIQAGIYQTQKHYDLAVLELLGQNK
ncbi:MAG TPA: tetratricopeptide repeat protein [Anaerohalosphaeraceae bacterium]|nr:tetratricopeptide repeat protein [Phycisphaerae bacterium]HOK95032.1 tetratricopeptide repeat protein [Anaerohalosphaeraceae bacterium]HOL30343.1 tetratricopeptide repeat protein [Anaerohalosphaeraceae bacterium]HOM75399.1 tetratricopeptide repeat protein [Anaerohalosphaeraceae bacterium]HPC63041.1 tetratricopeptide repeat protein [Anaerohalosphaeraceae bacterium]